MGKRVKAGGHRRPWKRKYEGDLGRASRFIRMKCMACRKLTTVGKHSLGLIRAAGREPDCKECGGRLKPN